MLLLLVGVDGRSQSTQNNTFAVSLKEVRDKYDFLLEDKHESFLQASSIVFTDHSKACPNYPKWQVCNIFAISQK